jgi:hypothetical protein
MNRKSLLNLNFYAKTSIERALSKDSSFFLRTQSKETKNQKKDLQLSQQRTKKKPLQGALTILDIWQVIPKTLLSHKNACFAQNYWSAR